MRHNGEKQIVIHDTPGLRTASQTKLDTAGVLVIASAGNTALGVTEYGFLFALISWQLVFAFDFRL